MRWKRTAADNGDAHACLLLAYSMYMGQPHAREIGHFVGEAAGVAASAGVLEGHDVPGDVLTDVVYWLQKGGHNLPPAFLNGFASERWRGVSIATTKGARLWPIERTSNFARSARPPCIAAPRVRNRLGLRVGTRKSVARLRLSQIHGCSRTVFVTNEVILA